MTYKAFRKEAERMYWSTLIQMTDGNASEAGRIAGIHRQSVPPILRRLGIDASAVRPVGVLHTMNKKRLNTSELAALDEKLRSFLGARREALLNEPRQQKPIGNPAPRNHKGQFSAGA
jgi:hypothetical protein